MRRRMGRVLLLLLAAQFVSAADVSGRWAGTLEFKGPDGQAQKIPAGAAFKQQGSEITGAVWKEAEHQFPIDNGKILGNAITFDFKAPEGEEEATLVHRVKLTLTNENQLVGELEFENDGQKMSGKLTFTQEK